MKKIVNQLFVLAILVSSFACSDDDTAEIKPNEGNFLIGSMIMNTETYEGRNYFQLVEELDGQSINLENAISTEVTTPKVSGNNLYIFPSYMGSGDDLLVKYTINDGILQKGNSLNIKPKAAATNMVFLNDTKAYVSMAGLGEIMIINPETMKEVGKIDIREFARGDNNPNPGAMLIRDDKLYVGLNQFNAENFPQADFPVADVVIIDTKTDKSIKRITESTTGLACATRPIAEETIFKDESGDIYIICIGGFGKMPTHKTGILRIKQGETEFDKDFMWEFNTAVIEGDANKVNFIQTVCYGGNGKLYAYGFSPDYVGPNDNAYTADATIALEVDLYAKTITRIKDIPLSNSYGMGIYRNGNQIIFCSSSKSGNAFYSYNPANREVKKALDIKGFPVFFHRF